MWGIFRVEGSLSLAIYIHSAQMEYTSTDTEYLKQNLVQRDINEIYSSKSARGSTETLKTS